MNELFLDFSDESSIFDTSINRLNIEFMEAISNYIEAYSVDEYISESEKDSLVVTIKKFFAGIISSLRSFVDSIKQEVSKNSRFAKTDSQLHKMHKELVAKKEEGCKEVKVVDVWNLEKIYIKDVEDLKTLAKKFSKMKYTRVSDLNNDMAEFNKLYEKSEKELEEASEKLIVVPIDKMINFVEDEISNRSTVFDSINDCITLMEKMKDDACNLEKQYTALGPDMIPKHMSFIRKMSISITTFIKKWVGKFIAKIVFIFA